MFFASLVIASSLLVQSFSGTGTAAAKPLGKAVLEETTGHHFQIFEFVGRPPHTWEHAELMVSGYMHEGVPGQLAKIPTADVHYFLLGNFPLVGTVNMWFGLTAICRDGTAFEWVDGTALVATPFRAWSDGAQRKISRGCRAGASSFKRFPVYYNSSKFGMRWEAANARTDVRYMIVEFVPLKKEENEAESKAVVKDDEASKSGTQ
ncbi:MAG: hypothetical protein COB37_05825 [Kordiimonadales bacterium]|nr:MAG: hypothetical protein COB37_05825 [Kordiimonadales bacterium]